jgi:4-amino-4-deoxy-L-arabinose transferase-like glycosyltransferase
MSAVVMKGLSRRWPGVLAVALAIVAATRIIATYSVLSHTWDEPAHIACGLELLSTGRYAYEVQHPPLARLAVAVAPYLHGIRSRGRVGMWDEGMALLYRSHDYKGVLALARLGTLPFFLLTLYATWLWARRLHGKQAALVSVFLLINTPPLLGHAGLATTDLALVGLGVAALDRGVAWFERPTLVGGVLLVTAASAALLCKFSAGPFLIAAFIALVGWRIIVGPRAGGAAFFKRDVWLGLSLGVLVGLAIAWAAYGFGLGTLRKPSQPQPTAAPALARLAERPIWPAFVAGIRDGVASAAHHNRMGHTSFLLGEIRSDGWWYYYPVALLVKTPIALLLLALVGSGLLLRQSWRGRDWRPAASVISAVGILAFAMTSRINIGVRHVLILYPLMAILAGHATVTLLRLRAGSSRRRLVTGVVVALLAWQTWESVTAHPDYIAYFNVIAGRTPERVLVNGDLDWGQDLSRLASEVRKRRIERIHVAYNGWTRLHRHVPGAAPLPPYQPISGWVAISLWTRIVKGDAFAWLRDFTPATRVGRSIDLYFIPEDAVTSPAALSGARPEDGFP